MKINVVAIVLLLVSSCSVVSLANDGADHPFKGMGGGILKARFKAKVILLNRKIITGYFVKVADDSLHLLDPKVNDIVRIPVMDIQTIKLRRKGAIWKGAVIGAVTGLTTGIVLTSASLKDPCDTCDEGNEEFSYVIGAIVGYAYGGLAGMFIGMHQKKFKINGHLRDRTARRLERCNAEAPQ